VSGSLSPAQPLRCADRYHSQLTYGQCRRASSHSFSFTFVLDRNFEISCCPMNETLLCRLFQGCQAPVVAQGIHLEVDRVQAFGKLYKVRWLNAKVANAMHVACLVGLVWSFRLQKVLHSFGESRETSSCLKRRQHLCKCVCTWSYFPASTRSQHSRRFTVHGR
jgi:hypothetical protein